MGEEKPFTVRDRRLFTSDGERRGEEPVQSEAPDAVAVPSADPEPTPVAGPPRADEEKVEFAGFIASLASQASLLLTAEGDELAQSLDAARQLISILEMLEDKTRGRRTPEEEHLLEQVLYELRMGYVERSRAVGA